jgi:hypothetical protein
LIGFSFETAMTGYATSTVSTLGFSSTSRILFFLGWLEGVLTVGFLAGSPIYGSIWGLEELANDTFYKY